RDAPSRPQRTKLRPLTERCTHSLAHFYWGSRWTGSALSDLCEHQDFFSLFLSHSLSPAPLLSLHLSFSSFLSISLTFCYRSLFCLSFCPILSFSLHHLLSLPSPPLLSSLLPS